MLILACDTSGPSLGAALWRDGALAGEICLKSANPHSSALLPAIDGLLRQTGLAMRDIDAFACSVGPGSFTGIRIGVSSVKAMAYAAGRPAIGVSALEAMAWPYASCSCQVSLPMIDARNHRLFASAWYEGQEVLPEANWQAADFAAALSGLSGRLAAVGPAVSILAIGYLPDVVKHTASNLGFTLNIAPGCARLPRAAAIAEIAEQRLAAGAEGRPQMLLPQYLSLTQAERLQAMNRGRADHA